MYPVAGNVDYLRVSVPRDCKPAVAVAYNRAREAVLRSQGGKYAVKPWFFRGYSGFSCGHVSWGNRHDGSLLQVSGPPSGDAVKYLPGSGLGIPRIDLAVTVWFPEEDRDIAKKCAPSADIARQKSALTARRRLKLTDGMGAGDTLSVGSRKSEQYGRIYDKFKESRNTYYKNAWRWEVEYKGKTACSIWKQLAEVGAGVEVISSTVYNWFEERGCPPPIEVSAVPLVAVLPDRTSTTDTRRLEWLAKQVAPCLPGLIDRVGRDVVYSALGISEQDRDFPDGTR